MGGNVAISPYSVINTLTTLAQATNGETLNQIKRSLHFVGGKSDLVDVFVNYTDLFRKNAKNLPLLTANKVYVHDSYQINEQFRKVATHQLESGVETVNFLDTTEAAGIISDFVVEKTQNKIRDFLNPTSRVFNNTVPSIVAINAMYMRIAWKNVYESIYTRVGYFNGYKDFDTATVDFMYFYYRHKFNYANLPDLNASAVEIKLHESDFTLLLILPEQDYWDYNPLPSKIKNYDLTKITDQMQEEFVEVIIPKFKIEYQASLKDTLEKVRNVLA